MLFDKVSNKVVGMVFVHCCFSSTFDLNGVMLLISTQQPVYCSFSGTGSNKTERSQMTQRDGRLVRSEFSSVGSSESRPRGKKQTFLQIKLTFPDAL